MTKKELLLQLNSHTYVKNHKEFQNQTIKRWKKDYTRRSLS